MKKHRKKWEDDFIKYIFKAYEHTGFTTNHCNKCPFYIGFDYLNKLCKHVCIF